MNSYIIDQEVLGQFVDELMKKKPLSANTAEELNDFRSKTMKDLDNSINVAIFNSLPTEKLAEFENLLDDKNTSPDIFQRFFSDSGVDLQKVTDDTLNAFTKKFLGGQDE